MTRHIMIAVPTHSETVTLQTASTLMQLSAILEKRGYTVSTEWFSGSVISEVRNILASAFIHSKAERLIMIDADQGLPRELLNRFLDSDKEIVGCIYPKRKLDWHMVDYTKFTAMDDAIYAASTYVGRLESKLDDKLQFDVTDGWAKAIYVGTGAMVVRRSVFERMIARFPELKDEGYHTKLLSDERFQHNWGFFNPLPREVVGQPLAEDFAFCHRWRVGCGGEIWADVITSTQHVGRYVYSGNYLAHLKARHRDGFEGPEELAAKAAAPPQAAKAHGKHNGRKRA